MSIRESVSPPITRPILPVHHMGSAATFYERLGFNVDLFDSTYAVVGHSGGELFHLQVKDDLDRNANPAAMYVHVTDADQWHSMWEGDGIDLSDVADRPWGMREFSLTDPSGNSVRVGGNV